jgi:hypothetical protein
MTTYGGQVDERTEILDFLSELKVFGMKAAFDEVVANGVKRRNEPQQIIGDLLKAEVAEKAARSIKYSSPSPSCRLPRTSRTSSSKVRRLTRRS